MLFSEMTIYTFKCEINITHTDGKGQQELNKNYKSQHNSCLCGFVCRWSGRGPVAYGGGASSAPRELRGEGGIVGTRLLTSMETCNDNLGEGIKG